MMNSQTNLKDSTSKLTAQNDKLASSFGMIPGPKQAEIRVSEYFVNDQNDANTGNAYRIEEVAKSEENSMNHSHNLSQKSDNIQILVEDKQSFAGDEQPEAKQ